MRACVRVCVRACVRVCVRACLCVCLLAQGTVSAFGPHFQVSLFEAPRCLLICMAWRGSPKSIVAELTSTLCVVGAVCHWLLTQLSPRRCCLSLALDPTKSPSGGGTDSLGIQGGAVRRSPGRQQFFPQCFFLSTCSTPKLPVCFIA